jgi:threonine aldolase
MICGSKSFINKVHRVRKQLGGGMRQAGVLAAAGIIALESMVDRLAEDHRRARELAQALDEIERIEVENINPPTNMVYLRFQDSSEPTVEKIVAGLAEEGIRVNPPRGGRMRLVTHYWIDDEALEKTISSMRQLLSR